MFKIFMSVIFLLLFLVPPSEAALSKKSDMLNPAQVSNPKPAEGDVLLPMPGGLQMAFRAVCVPAAGYLDATEIQLGVYDGGFDDGDKTAGAGQPASGKGSGYRDNSHSVSISAPFELQDLPAGWGQEIVDFLRKDPACAFSERSDKSAGKSADASGAMQPFVYFIGKYEISRAQWRAVMEWQDNGRAMELSDGDYLPKVSISWFDAQEFTRRYSEWLMAKHPNMLPYFKQEKRSAFIRMPSEQEWEFAARGGHKVDMVERSRTSLFPIGKDEEIKDYISARFFEQSLSIIGRIGSKKPNPLGLYDMLGNCSEMVFSPFQLVSGGRLIGGYGGFIIKGGSWQANDQADLNPGRRYEAGYYLEGKAMSNDDLGFRLSIGSILNPGERQDKLRREWAERSKPQAAQADAVKDDVRVVIQEIVREVKIDDPNLLRRLEQAEQIAGLYHQKVNESEERMIRETVLGALFSLETVNNYSIRCYQDVVTMENAAKADPVGLADVIAKRKTDIDGFTHGINSTLFYYLSMLREMSRFDTQRLSTQTDKVALQFVDTSNGFSRNMNRRLNVLRKHQTLGTGRPLSEMEVLRETLNPAVFERIKSYF